MSSYHYTSETPDEVKNAKGLHLITQNTPNGQAVQIFLEELKDAYGTEFTTTVIALTTALLPSVLALPAQSTSFKLPTCGAVCQDFGTDKSQVPN